jgi:hypothetical protein
VAVGDPRPRATLESGRSPRVSLRQDLPLTGSSCDLRIQSPSPGLCHGPSVSSQRSPSPFSVRISGAAGSEFGGVTI